MSMISDFVDRLRAESKLNGKYGNDYTATLLMQASDTIEMLSEKARAEAEHIKMLNKKLEQTQTDIVRCGECKHYENGNCENDSIYMNVLSGDIIGVSIKPWKDDFCSYGERRE